MVPAAKANLVKAGMEDLGFTVLEEHVERMRMRMRSPTELHSHGHLQIQIAPKKEATDSYQAYNGVLTADYCTKIPLSNH
uniref:Uncharacterized protein n=1 Tax=Nelumbo nucifera TaxID=4432 RepID=A0A822Z048_NELNU|nr:TPA_asm: hypothetical protein HUJ06_008781 [Nelumbo nucifera]